jgi:Fur family iron response transcriptional regulator
MLRDRLASAGLRPTRQRLSLGELLFAMGDRHVTAEQLHEEAMAGGILVSLATVYNTLHQFTEAGLLRAVAVDGSKTFFDTNTSDHHHFYFEADGSIMDVPDSAMQVVGVPGAPDGFEIARVDVVVRLVQRTGG